MKKCLAILTLLSAACTSLLAELNEDNYNPYLTSQDGGTDEGGPFSLAINGNATGKADFKHRSRGWGKGVEFAIVNPSASLVFYYNRACKEGLMATVGYTYTSIDFENSYIRQNHFNTLSLGIGGLTHRFCDWELKGLVQVNADINHFNYSDYLTYNLAFVGRYSWSECVGINLGFIWLTGMEINRLYPVIGADWRINADWKLSLIFPLDLSLSYYLTPEWAIQISGRAFDERHRVGRNEPVKRAVVEYRAAGAELDIDYTSCDERRHFNLHVGCLLGGDVQIWNRHHHHSHRHRFNSAPYAGGDFSIRF